MAAAAILNLLPSRFLAYRRFWIMVLCVPVKFYLNRGRVIKFCKKNSKWRLSAILNYCVAILNHSRSLIVDRKPVLKFRVH